jgi:hypothetical protein
MPAKANKKFGSVRFIAQAGPWSEAIAESAAPANRGTAVRYGTDSNYLLAKRASSQ